MKVEITSKSFDGQKIMVSVRFTDGETVFDKSYQVTAGMTMKHVQMMMDKDVLQYEELKATYETLLKGEVDLTTVIAERIATANLTEPLIP